MQPNNHSCQFLRFHAGHWEALGRGVIGEAPVSLTVNGQVWLSFMCTPLNLEALAVGFLFNEGIIQKREDVASVRVCPSGDNVDVWLRFVVEQPRSWKRTSGCAGGVTAAPDDALAIAPHLDGVVLTPRQINGLVEQLLDAQDLYRQVGGVHTSVLSDGPRPWIVAEDIGRHNTLDKISGHYLLDGLELRRKILLTTGRISSEMLQKAARLNVSVVISRTSPSSLSIEMAQTRGITLVGYARRDQFNVYTHAERIVSTAGEVCFAVDCDTSPAAVCGAPAGLS